MLQHVNLTVGQHESVCMVGPNGGGKTTLLKLILGLLEPAAAKSASSAGRRGRSGSMGYMPQHVQHDPQFPATVMDIVLMGRLGGRGLRGLLGWYSRDDRRAALGRPRPGRHGRPRTAAAGHPLRRPAAAGAHRPGVCSQPELLLLDEPTAEHRHPDGGPAL